MYLTARSRRRRKRLRWIVHLLVFAMIGAQVFYLFPWRSQEIDWKTPSNAVSIVRANSIKVIDADTVQLADGTRLRLVGWDSPEQSTIALCTREGELGKRASNAAKALFRAAYEFSYIPVGKDPLGQTLSHWALDERDYTNAMAPTGLIKPWRYGFERKPDWCDDEE